MSDRSGIGGLQFGFSSTTVTIKEEAEVYPFTSFMAEVGGALGLFLGLSFLSFWDMFVDATNWCIGKKLSF